MTAKPRWEQVKLVLQAALDREPRQRAAFLREACGADAALQAEVESLLDAYERAGSFADGPAVSGPALGETFGPYQITGWLGCGAMGEVYRARDLRLNRDVALKLVPELFAFDTDRLARLTREAQILASLNHPNIAAIHGLEHAGNRQALVLELIEGPTLADRIQQGPVPFEEAVSIARQIGAALESAHEQGIIHRDLKPSNVKLRPDGVVKVLDFSLAKLAAPTFAGVTDGDPPVRAAAGTREGMIVGTIAYMSPEQARAKPVDKRTDIWAFGCVLYEMLTGMPAFAGDDAAETIAVIVRGEPAWDVLPATTPSNISNLLRRCLTKDPFERLRDIGDARLVMDGAFAPDAPGHRDSSRAPSRFRWKPVAIAAVGVLICSIASGVLVWLRVQPEPWGVARFTIPLSAGERFYYRGRQLAAISDDQRAIVYSANQGLYLRRLDQLEAVPVPGTEDGGRSPFLSPDGAQIGFWNNNQLKTVAVSGGAPVTLSTVPNPWGVSWESDDTILLGEGAQGIWRVPAGGGAAEVLIRVAAGELAHGPHLLAGGEWILFTLLPQGARSWSEAQIVAHSLRTNERRVLIHGGHDARYVRTGHLLYALNGALMAVGFDVRSLRILDSPVKLVEPVADAGGVTGASQFSVTPDGALLFIPTIASPYQHALTWVDRDGREQPIPAPVRAYVYPRISPDGTRVAVDVRDQDNDIWIWDVAEQTLTRLTFDPGSDGHPAWTPDGRQIAFMSERDGGGLFLQAADGSGPIERLTSGDGRFPSAFSSDGTHLLFWGPGITRSPSDIGMIAARPGARPSALVQTEAGERNAEPSPDGRWIAYQSDESGQTEVFVRAFPDIDKGRWQISTAGGERPRWAQSGRELFYVGPDGLMVASVESTPTFRAGPSRLLFDNRYFLRDPGFVSRTYDVSPDGRRFLLIKSAREQESPSQLVVVLNWPEELKRRASAEPR